MEMLELVEKIRSEEASTQKLFGSDGRSARPAGRSAQYLGLLAEAAALIADVQRGRRPAYLLQEAMTTSDFPYLFGDILDRQMLAAYQEFPSDILRICRRSVVPDFRQIKRFPALTGVDGQLAKVAEKAEYPVDDLSETSPYTYYVYKYGRKVPISWETLINDDLGNFTDIPQRLARAARRSEAKFVTGMYCTTTGPDSTFFSDANLNRMTVAAGADSANPVLSTAALGLAMKLLSKQTVTIDGASEPVYVDMVYLVVPPALEVTARNILNATQIIMAETGGTSNQTLWADNWMRNRVQLIVDPYIPIVASSSNGSTSWFLFAAPSVGTPALEIGFLRGHEAPEIFIKSPNAARVGGGMANPLDGDFDTDAVEYKVRHVFGGATMLPKMAVASNGSGA